ncbi:MAG: hypothetical protein ACJAZP_000891 [Psychromonas sp.]|jgi:hypothetical protein|uniref:hypothetical protein n=1 Tax=Psychromonas sp. TaxID=1884585 RepID=UPI0039E6EE34
MKLKTLMTSMIVLSFSGAASAMDIKFADSAWDGIKIPEGQQCQKFGGNNPSTPKWIITGITPGASAVVLEYSDRDSKNMNNGGHGRMSFAIDSTAKNVEIPSIPGHTFDIPPKFTMIEEHRGSGWDIAGAYMPPCSGGKDHAYYVTIKILKGDMVTAESVVEMGKY